MFDKLVKIVIIVGAVLGTVAFILHFTSAKKCKKSNKENYPNSSDDKEIFFLNKLSHLHNKKINNTIIRFCKIDFILDEFKYIDSIPNNVILITGNGDHHIDDDLASKMPSNVIKWYGTNNLTSNSKIISLPLGVENSIESLRKDHGIAWDRAVNNNKLLTKRFNKPSKIVPKKLIYANWTNNTYPEWRQHIMNEAARIPHITVGADRSYDEFISDILNHEAIICPRGNGPDTHRLWETIYMGRIPIIFREEPAEKQLYETLYKDLPIVILDRVSDLSNELLIKQKIKDVAGKSREKATLNYWKNEILTV